MKRQQVKYLVIIFFIVIVVLFALGQVVGENCSTIGSCRQCWDTVSRTIYSDLCPTSEPCWAEANEMQHNALVDLLICACAEAKTDEYTNTAVNNEIVTIFREMSGYTIDVQELCENPTLYLTKWSYS